jgi:hypothetical protein
MKTKIVTAFYTDIKNFPFYGHIDYSRHERYLHSLRTLNNLNTEIICYCNKTQLEILKKYCLDFNLNNIVLKVSNLFDLPFANRMKEIKETTNNYKFYHEVDWNKFFLLEKEYSEEYDYIYWIDVGLSHRGLFLEKYNPFSDKIDGLSRTYENYSFLGIFNQTMIQKLNLWVGENLINLSNTSMSHNVDDINKLLKSNIVFKSLSVGGIIGGNVKNLKWFINTFYECGQKILNNNSIINHELIMSYIYEINQDKFKKFEFETWYHNDYWKTTPIFDNDSIKDKIHFVHFFENELKL